MADPIFTVDPAFYNVLIPVGATMNTIYGFTTDNNTYTRQPPWKGLGYIAGEAPDGLVTFNGDGAVRTLDLWDRAENVCVMSTVSAADGTYRFDGLNLDRLFDVRARGVDANENDLIAARIAPLIRPLKIIGTFPDGVVGASYDEFIQVDGGDGTYSNLRVLSGSIPGGLSLSIGNNLIRLSGIMTGGFSSSIFTLAVDSGDGQTTSSDQTIGKIKWYASLFANGEQGMVFDFNDLQSMFTDTTHLNPVASVGDQIKSIRCAVTGAYAVIQGSCSMVLDFDASRNLYKGKIITTSVDPGAVMQATGSLPASLGGDNSVSLVAAAEYNSAEQGVPILIGPAAVANGNALALGNLFDPGNRVDFLQFGSGRGIQSDPAADGVQVLIGTKGVRAGTAPFKIYRNGALAATANVSPIGNITTLNLDICRVTSAGRSVYACVAVNREISASEAALINDAAMRG